MSDTPTIFDDLLDPAEPFDAAQYAMHGLLSIYFENAIDRSPQRAQAILDRAAREAGFRPSASLTSSWFRVSRRWVLRIGGLSAAAVILLVVGLLFRTSPVRADIYADAANAGAAWFRLVGSVNFVLEPDSPEGRAQQRELVRLEREVRAGFERFKQLPPNVPGVTDFCQTWQTYYCLLRDLGQREEAIREVQAVVAFSKARPDKPMLANLLDGLGNVYAAFGEYAAAREAYMESIKVRRESFSIDWNSDPHYGEPGYEGQLGWGITPAYLRVMNVAMADGKLVEAREHFNAARRSIGQRLRTTCELNHVSVPPVGASLWELWLALPSEYQRPKATEYTPEELRAWSALYPPNGSCPAWVRAVLYHEALLLHAEGNHAAAEAALDRAGTVPDYPDFGEFRLPFLENLERARLAIIGKDYAAASNAVNAARAYVLDPASQRSALVPEVNKLPVKPIQAGELNLLDGVALLGQDPKSEQGRQLVQQALDVPTKLASGLPVDQCGVFLKQFETWKQLLDTGNKSSSLLPQRTEQKP